MSNVNKVVIDFFRRIDYPELSIEELSAKIAEEFEPLAKLLHIGRFTESINAPESILSINGLHHVENIYIAENGVGERPVTYTYITGEKGTVETVFYPEKGYEWNDDEKSEIHFISDMIYNIQGKARMASVIKRLLITDMATGAFNAAGMHMHCEKIKEKNELDKYSLIFLNLKNFKFVNKIAGERQGDMVIRDYARKLIEYIVDGECAARPGGDNFMVLIRKNRERDFLGFIDNISFTVGNDENRQTINLSARVGVYEINSEDTANDAISGASAALGRTKRIGVHNVVRFSRDILMQTIQGNEILNLFTDALRSREFEIYYQPKIRLSDKALCGCEALTRWIRNGKVVPPIDFIPVLENDGSICRLDFYVLETVCADIRRWLDSGIEPVRVSVNFSKMHLNNPELAEHIIDVLKKYDIGSKYIEIELTESSAYEEYGALENLVAKMREYGISTSIDDFGTGYSSLNMLKNLDVDIIKLDKSFLDNLDGNNTNDEVVVRHIVNMVNDLNMKVVAEGVETGEQADLLNNINCSMAQGYFFDKPMPCIDFEKRLSGARVY